jgi:hypothetical protein
MRTFYIIDSLGARHATIKAKSEFEAVEIYCEGFNDQMRSGVLAIEESQIKTTIKNLTNL